MGFWIFMLVMDLLFPVIMIVMGKYFMKTSPKEINYIFGYRTNMSMKNKDTWDFAHKYIGKLWFYIGLFLVPITIIPMLFAIGSNKDIVGTVGGIICVVSLVILIVPIFPTERALKRVFDGDGNRKVEQKLIEHKKKLIAPIIVSIIMVVYYVAYFGVLIALIDGVWKWLLGIIPLALSAVMLKVCIERINEIKKGEEDDLSKY